MGLIYVVLNQDTPCWVGHTLCSISKAIAMVAIEIALIVIERWWNGDVAEIAQYT